eukprot:859034-Alexandrium_andersonii.AAC.1
MRSRPRWPGMVPPSPSPSRGSLSRSSTSPRRAIRCSPPSFRAASSPCPRWRRMRTWAEC